MKRATACLFLSALSLGLAACAAGSGNYPSLAKRDAERVEGTALPALPVPRPEQAAPGDGKLENRIDQLVGDAKAANTNFEGRSNAAAKAIAGSAGSQPSSRGWIEAQLALADLQSMRSNTVIALADLDTLYAQDRIANAGRVSPATASLQAAREQVGSWVAQQDDLLTRLGERARR